MSAILLIDTGDKSKSNSIDLPVIPQSHLNFNNYKMSIKKRQESDWVKENRKKSLIFVSILYSIIALWVFAFIVAMVYWNEHKDY